MSLRIERVVVTGGRKFTDGARIEADLRALLPLGLKRVAQGGARGADGLAADVAVRLRDELAPGGLRLETPVYRADWDADGRAAGPRRNVRMLEAEKPDLVLAYPDPESRGTWHCVREACKRGITTVIWAPFVEMYDFMGEDEIKPGIYVDGPKGNIMRIDDSRRESHGRASDGGWANLELHEEPPRFIISTFDNGDLADRLLEVFDGA